MFHAPRHLPVVIVIMVLTGIVVVPADAAVILNTLQGYEWTEPGWSGGLDTIFSASGGNTERILFEGGGRIQWRSDRNRLRLQAAGSYEKNSGVETARSTVVHLRQNHRLSRQFVTIAFAQRQHNPFQRLESRWLFGAGLRWDIRDNDRGQLAIGATPMLEIERLDGEEDHRTLARWSIFLFAARNLREGVKLDAVGFYQPAWNDPLDFRATANLTFVVEVTDALDLRVGYAIEHDDDPPVGVKKTDWRTFVGLAVDL